MSPVTAKRLAIFCHIIAVVWVILVVLLIFVSILGMFLSEPSFTHGWKRVIETFSPFNIANFIVTIIFLLPAIGAFKLKEYFEKIAGPGEKNT